VATVGNELEHFKWLHLSDLHVGLSRQDWMWPSLKHLVFDDFKRVHSQTGNWDIVIFSGDLTQSGARDEFDKLDEILQELWAQFANLGFAPKLIVLPGNHDVSRPTQLRPELRLLKRWWTESDLHEEFFDEPPNEYQAAILAILEKYIQWEKRLAESGIPLVPKIAGMLPGDQSCIVEKAGARVGIIGLNSTWLQLDGDDYDGKLHVDPRQLLAVTGKDPRAWCDRNIFNIIVTHHPVSWLHPESQSDWNNEINPAGLFNIHLFGHMHEATSASTSISGSPIRRSYQAASIFGLAYVDGKVDRVHGYCASRLDLRQKPGELRIWPRRLRKIQGGSSKLGPDLSFDLDENNSVALIQNTQSNALVSQPETGKSLSLRVLGDDLTSREVLKKVTYHLPKYEAHYKVRRIEQATCIEHLGEVRAVWLSSEWGMGEDGFVASVRQARNEPSRAVYRLDLSEYKNRDQLSDSIKQALDVGLDRFCELLANAGKSILLLDNIAVASGQSELSNTDLEELIAIVLEYCPNLTVFFRSVRAPQNTLFPVVTLNALDEADLRNYLLDHERGGASLVTTQSVTEIHRYTEGIPARIDRALKELEVVPLSELLSSNSDLAVHGTSISEASPSLRLAISELSGTSDSVLRRSYSLLKALCVFPHGEQLTRIKRFNSTAPFFARHATELLDLKLIDVTTVQGLEFADSSNAAKTLIVPKPVRELVRENMTDPEKEELNRKAADMYFGNDWARGTMKPPPAYRFDMPTRCGADIANASTIIIRLLKHATAIEAEHDVARVLGLAQSFLSAVVRGDHYRSGVTFCEDIFPLIPSLGFEDKIALLRVNFAKCLRMTDEQERSKEVTLEIGDYPFPLATRQSVLLNLAFCHQSLRELAEARTVAEEIIRLDRHSTFGLQAKALTIELDVGDPEREKKLLRLEAQCRKSDANVVANNIALLRARELPDDPEGARRILAPIVQTSRTTKDFYNATRAVIELAELSTKSDERLTESDQSQLITAYHFVFNERFSSLFDRCHAALWKNFSDNEDKTNLLTLFRHSSLFWRLRGQESREIRYVRDLKARIGTLISQRSSNLSREAAYYQSRAANLLLEPPGEE
jgi:predicted MPP superfamily phosphohydrolase